MAILYPKGGPVKNESYTAEPTIYYTLARQLPDDFIIIHSIPWIAQVANEVDGRNIPTGEIDFLILHPTLGILALEVKGGNIHYEHNMAVLKNGDRFDPVAQVRRGIHGLSQWVFKASDSKIAYKFGYGVVFPQSMLKGRNLPPALIDMTAGTSQCICFDRQDLPSLGTRVIELMSYWQHALGNRPLTSTTRQAIVELLLPDPDFTPSWVERIELTRQQYLLLTEQQSVRLQQIVKYPRFVLTGRSGTGKTLLAIEYALRLATEGKRVLFLVYNVLLTTAIKEDLRKHQQWLASTSQKIDVRNYQELCRFASQKLDRSHEQEKGKHWYKTFSHLAFHDAIQNNLMGSYDALVVDEGQVFHTDWLADLERWFHEKPIFICCDETQSFSYEYKTAAEEIARIIHTPKPFTLTNNMRSPRPIFHRLEQVMSSPYEQQSQRDDEQSTLQEIANPDSLWQLHNVIKQLHSQHIPAEHIMVIYWKTVPTYRPGFEKLIGQTISVYRCRGIEAPVVIVWPHSDPIDDMTWACAYSRATSRCIAIYQPDMFLDHYDTCQFAKVVPAGNPDLMQWIYKKKEDERKQLENKRNQQALRAIQIETLQDLWALWPSPSWEIIKLNHFVVQWSCSWQAWYLSKRSSLIETQLWAKHVAITSSQYVYAEIQIHESDYRYLSEYNPVTRLHALIPRTITVSCCPTCKSWSRGYMFTESNDIDSSWQCSECTNNRHQLHRRFTTPIPVEVNAIKITLQNIVETATIFSIALSDWIEFQPHQQRFIEYHCKNAKGSLKWIVRILTAMFIVSQQSGALIETKNIHLRSWERCPWLATQITEEQWLEAFLADIRMWSRQKVLLRKSKGIYEVLSLDGGNPLLTL